MTYQETVDYLYHCTPVFEKIGVGAYKEGLSTTLAFDEHFGHPHRQFRSIHVAGTNGKGSVSHSLASILQAQGLKVGLYTSPHLVDFRERIRVNGVCIGEQYVVDFVEQERAFFEPLHPSFFELTTALAFKYFAEQHVDIAVVEVGLGGRLDCTNIITPEVSVITNISLDHTELLGGTLELIAAEKAGIMKAGVPVVIGERQEATAPVFTSTAARVGAPLIFAEDEGELQSAALCLTGGMDYETATFGHLHGELSGLYQQKNTATILAVCRQLIAKGLLRDDPATIADGLAHVVERTGLVGRWQQLREHPTVVCDTGHNVGGWMYLSAQLSAQVCDRMRIVFGMVSDKDISTVMSLLPKDADYYFTQASSKRAIPAEEVARIGAEHGLHGKRYATVAEAYHAALSDAGPDDFIFVGGSSYVVADLLAECRSVGV